MPGAGPESNARSVNRRTLPCHLRFTRGPLAARTRPPDLELDRRAPGPPPFWRRRQRGLIRSGNGSSTSAVPRRTSTLLRAPFLAKDEGRNLLPIRSSDPSLVAERLVAERAGVRRERDSVAPFSVPPPAFPCVRERAGLSEEAPETGVRRGRRACARKPEDATTETRPRDRARSRAIASLNAKRDPLRRRSLGHPCHRRALTGRNPEQRSRPKRRPCPAPREERKTNERPEVPSTVTRRPPGRETSSRSDDVMAPSVRAAPRPKPSVERRGRCTQASVLQMRRRVPETFESRRA
jgi:hypothetical protein